MVEVNETSMHELFTYGHKYYDLRYYVITNRSSKIFLWLRMFYCYYREYDCDSLQRAFLPTTQFDLTGCEPTPLTLRHI